MGNNNNIIFGYALEKYNKKYRHRGYRLLKYTKKEVKEFDKLVSKNVEAKNFLLKNRKWVLIGDSYYEIPRPIRFTWFRNLNAGVQTLTCVLLAGAIGGGAYGTYYLINNKVAVHNEEVFIEGDATYDVTKSFVAIGKESTLYLKPKTEGLKLKIKAVYVGDIELAASEYTFSPDDNKLVIQASSMNSLKIKIKLEETTDLRKLFIEKANEWVSGKNGFLNVATTYAKEQIKNVIFEKQEILSKNYSIKYEDFEGSRICYLMIYNGSEYKTLLIGSVSFSGKELEDYLLPIDDGGIYDVKDTYIEYSTTKQDATVKHIKLNKWGYIEEMLTTYQEASITYSGDPQEEGECPYKKKFLENYTQYQKNLKENKKIYSETEICNYTYTNNGSTVKCPIKSIETSYDESSSNNKITINYLESGTSKTYHVSIENITSETMATRLKSSKAGAVYTFKDNYIKYYDKEAKATEIKLLVINKYGVGVSAHTGNGNGYDLTVLSDPLEVSTISRNDFLKQLDDWVKSSDTSFAKSKKQYSPSQLDNVTLEGTILDEDEYNVGYYTEDNKRNYKVSPKDTTSLKPVLFGSEDFVSSQIQNLIAAESEVTKFYECDDYILYMYGGDSPDYYKYLKVNKHGYITRLISVNEDKSLSDCSITYNGDPAVVMTKQEFLDCYAKYRKQYQADVAANKGYEKDDIEYLNDPKAGSVENIITRITYKEVENPLVTGLKSIACNAEYNDEEGKFSLQLGVDLLPETILDSYLQNEDKYYFNDITKEIVCISTKVGTMKVSQYGYFLKFSDIVASFGDATPHLLK